MRVKSIVIDGFKSYAHRKELADLSPHFNAITGLNGSGKSNIFDAICFVMGITNLKRVRAEDPRELIFRAGTTGVHAARVTIEFVNDDPASAPPGYSCEEYPLITIGRQIKLGGRQQFFFNNTVSLQSKVKRFFESISLNVDNPHFMILQGTVHKLIGMRSQDILSLIEEAVGTKAFDHRRRTAETLIRNKERKMEEIDTNIEAQIRPLLETMRADQEEYNTFMQMREKMEEKVRFRVALDYHTHRTQHAEAEAAMTARKADVQNAKTQLQALPRQEEEAARRLLQLQDSLSAPSEAAIALHEEEDELKKAHSRLEGQLGNCTKSLKQLETQLKSLRKEQERQSSSQAAFAARQREHEQLLAQIKEGKETCAKLKKGLKLLRSGVQAGASGVSLAEERQQVDLQLIEQQSRVRRATDRLEELVKQQRRVEAHQAEESSRVRHLEREYAKATASLEKAKAVYTPLALKQQRKEALEAEISSLKRECQAEYENFQRQVSTATARNYDLDYNRYACPPDTEDKVLGRVGQLITPTDPQHALGLMVGAQNQLLRVVVTDDRVAEAIIRSGLRQRTAFFALDKLQRQPTHFFIDGAKLQAARLMAEQQGGWVHRARDLVTVQEASSHQQQQQLNALADFVFGNFLVCSSLRLAQELAYDASIKAKAVTVEGEVAEPNGLMTGGSTRQLRDVFADLKTYTAQKEPLKALQQRTRALEVEYAALRDTLRQHQHDIQVYKTAEEAAELSKQRYIVAANSAQSGAAEQAEQIEREQTALAEAREKVEVLQARQRELATQAQATDLNAVQQEMADQLAAAEAHVARLTADEERGAAEFERLEADMEQQAADLSRKTQDTEEDMVQQQSQKLKLAAQVEEVTQQLAAVQARSKQNEERRQRLEKDIDDAQEELTRFAERKVTLDNLVKNGEVGLREQSRCLESLRRHVHEAEQRHSWLLEARATFNQPGGPYDFSDAARTAAILQELRDIEVRAAVMTSKLSQKSAILYEERRREYEELVKQRTALGEDKEAIQRCITEIESKKWGALDRMVGVVSSIFGKLFATCLPGATAQLLEERDAANHLSGLGVRVSFNGKPRESLSELSGGQRSLLALCLILAILRVRPAPLYILDEVDAALDPSHTQNIGRMLQLYFPHSQFLLVSLKDGMFNNANVLYHIRNTQGYSEVARIEHKPPPQPTSADSDTRNVASGAENKDAVASFA
ncbi:putative structural maintenance of chromosome (SMC) [Leishmania major strain Friedlin]|uniref:Structural maintenance of chromosomes protein n=1 Tax=Leishmania major TaxID=5664 RepID=Q4QJG2_LEIMA|nr:putative structural maintenance of chromosome (SMC) [Leishmania major strain Friedlin]CAG9568219.1 structural_maintenance_of_chromosome_(SMC)_-_putative [Leishmania major strain Friedlin]CAJ01960.1 putative structural maintenance of chromosome (SMC) [Leishmania major strain Friedlin]|eukprot:XP_001687517.1 putative structural maintenance of chromosome (SMC) [Leishmania major strain Friedlin]